MQIYFGENLKRLRRERDLTQEDVAQFLNTTFQTISKWERGETMPDIAVLPALARYFETTTDDLLGVAKLDEEAKMEEYYKLQRVYGNNGQLEEALAMWREAYAQFPHNNSVRSNLMSALYLLYNHDDKENDATEILMHANALLNDNDEMYKNSAIQVLCYIYTSMGNLEEAEKYAMMAPYYVNMQLDLLERVYKGEKLAELTQQNIVCRLDKMTISVDYLTRARKDDTDYCIQVNEAFAKVFETVFADGDFGFYHLRVRDLYRRLTYLYAKSRNTAETLRCIKSARHHAHVWDTAVTHTLTAPLVNTVVFDITQYSTTDPDARSSDKTDWLNADVYDFLRDTPEFKALCEG